MKKSTPKLALIVTIVVGSFLISCGGNKKSAIAKVKPEKVEISGDLAGYLQVVDNEYEVTENWGGHLSIKVKALKQLAAHELKGNDFDLSASLLGDNGMPVSGTGEFKMDYNSMDKLLSLLKGGSGEEVIQLKTNLGDYKPEEHADKSKKFVVSSTMKAKATASNSSSQSPGNSSSSDENASSSQSSDNSSDEKISVSGGKNWDKMLDDYEKYVHEYMKFYKSAMKGDQSALSEYPSLLEKATNLSVSMTNAQSDNQLNANQINRMVKIQTEMASAAIEMSK